MRVYLIGCGHLVVEALQFLIQERGLVAQLLTLVS